jgi:putative redox protein
MTNNTTISSVRAKNTTNTYTTHLTASSHSAIADEPLPLGGENAGATPGDYLCMSLASCKAITLRMYVQRKKWNIKNIEVKVTLEKQMLDDTSSNIFYAEIIVDEGTPPEQKERLLYIAKACPISKLLSKQNQVDTKIVHSFSI